MNHPELLHCASFVLRPARCFLLLVMVLASGSGCQRADGPPPAVTLEQLPSALESAFAKAKPEVKESLSSVLSALQNKEYSKALMALQTLSALPGLSKKQANIAAAGLVTINSSLQAAQNQGDQNAAQTLQLYRATK